MDSIRSGLSVLILFVLVGVTSVQAADWSMEAIDPFAKKKKAKPSIHRVPKATLSDPLAKLNAGTKRFFSGAIDLVTLKPITKTITKASYPWNHSTKVKKSKPSFFESWFAPTEKKKPPKTVNEWMSQDSLSM